MPGFEYPFRTFTDLPERASEEIARDFDEVRNFIGVIPSGGTVSFVYTGGAQTWTVPEGVTAITLDGQGAGGGTAAAGTGTSAGTGGAGSRCAGDFSVTPGDVITIYVGGRGNNGSGTTGGTGGYHGGGAGGDSGGGGFTPGGGGGGGGATEFYLAGTLLTAAGGGGGGSGAFVSGGGNNGANGDTSAGDVTAGGTGGLKGTRFAGGVGGATDGHDGTLGSGGAGGVEDAGGGGGGGGFYGGGGGGGSAAGRAAAGGGGGGSYSGGSNNVVSPGGGGAAAHDGAASISWGQGRSPLGPAMGDLSGSYPAPTVWRIQGNAVDDTSPSDGESLVWDAATSLWTPTTVTVSGAAGGDLSGTYPNPSVVDDSHSHTTATLPAAMPPNGSAGGDLSGTYPNPSVVDDSHSHTTATLPAAMPPNGTAGGDLDGSYPNPTLDTTGVAAATYGAAALVPQITVDAKGRITAATEVAAAGGAPSGSAGGVLDGTYPNPGLAASVAGAGLTETSDVLAVGAGTGITVNANDVAIDTAVTVRKYAVDVGDGVSTSITVTHNLGTRDVIVGVYKTASTYDEVECDVLHATTNTVTLVFSVAPTSAQYRCVVHA